MHERVYSRFGNVGISSEIPTSVEQRVGIPPLIVPVLNVVDERIYIVRSDVRILLSVPLNVEQRVRGATLAPA